MKLATYDVVLQEVPGEISLAFYIMGCPHACEGCHSELLWDKKGGQFLDEKLFLQIISRYDKLITCVLFMGGEWHEKDLVKYLKLARHAGYATALYTGEEIVSQNIKESLDFLKTGKYIKDLGGLSSDKTNQQFISLATGEKLNHFFH